MTVINTIAKQELNDSQSKNRKAGTYETSNKIELILPYPGKQRKKLLNNKYETNISGKLYQKTYR